MKKILFIISIFMLGVGNIGGFGYGLYLWGGTGMAFGLAAWTAFKFWVIWCGIGIALFINNFFMEYNKKRKDINSILNGNFSSKSLFGTDTYKNKFTK